MLTCRTRKRRAGPCRHAKGCVERRVYSWTTGCRFLCYFCTLLQDPLHPGRKPIKTVKSIPRPTRKWETHDEEVEQSWRAKNEAFCSDTTPKRGWHTLSELLKAQAERQQDNLPDCFFLKIQFVKPMIIMAKSYVKEMPLQNIQNLSTGCEEIKADREFSSDWLINWSTNFLQCSYK